LILGLASVESKVEWRHRLYLHAPDAAYAAGCFPIRCGRPVRPTGVTGLPVLEKPKHRWIGHPLRRLGKLGIRVDCLPVVENHKAAKCKQMAAKPRGMDKGTLAFSEESPRNVGGMAFSKPT